MATMRAQRSTILIEITDTMYLDEDDADIDGSMRIANRIQCAMRLRHGEQIEHCILT